MVLFFQSGYGGVWNRLVAGLDWARRFRVRLSAGMQPTPAAIPLGRKRLGWRVVAAALGGAAVAAAGQGPPGACCVGGRLAGLVRVLPCTPHTPQKRPTLCTLD